MTTPSLSPTSQSKTTTSKAQLAPLPQLARARYACTLLTLTAQHTTSVYHTSSVAPILPLMSSARRFKRKGGWYHSGKDKLYNSTDEELAYLPEIDGIPNFLAVTDPSEAPAALSFASLHAYCTSSEEPTMTRTADEWHKIFGHANMDILKRIAKAVKGMVVSTNSLSQTVCRADSLNYTKSSPRGRKISLTPASAWYMST
jgi:hypothetical protein